MLGYDPWLMTPREVARFRAACEGAGHASRPFLATRRRRVARTPGRAGLADPALALRFAGETSAAKRAGIAAGLAADGVDTSVLTAPNSIAWLLNVRGDDVENAPLALAFALLARDGRVQLFTDPRKLTAAAERHLGPKVAVKDLGGAGTGIGCSGAPQAHRAGRSRDRARMGFPAPAPRRRGYP